LNAFDWTKKKLLAKLIIDKIKHMKVPIKEGCGQAFKSKMHTWMYVCMQVVQCQCYYGNNDVIYVYLEMDWSSRELLAEFESELTQIKSSTDIVPKCVIYRKVGQDKQTDRQWH
jgi:hypothetical protein